MKRLCAITLTVLGMHSGTATAAPDSALCSQLFNERSPSLSVTVGLMEKGRFLIQDFASGYPANLDAWHQCASEGISGYLGKPVVVIPKPDRTSIKFRDGRTYTSAHPTLEALSVGRMVLDSSHPLSSFVNSSKNELEAEQRWLVGMNGALQERSSSTMFLNGCLIQYDSSKPFAQHFKYTWPADLAARLSQQDWDWMREHGNDIELWHEIGHCSTLVTETASHHPAANDMALSSLSKAVQPGQSCEAETLSTGWDNDNDRLLWGVIQNEYQADQYALKQLGLIDHSASWRKFRIASGIQYPKLEYMTWLGDMAGNRAQIMADSWAAINQLHNSRKTAAEPAQDVWSRLREAGQITAVVQPSLPPQDLAVSEWVKRLDGQQFEQLQGKK